MTPFTHLLENDPRALRLLPTIQATTFTNGFAVVTYIGTVGDYLDLYYPAGHSSQIPSVGSMPLGGIEAVQEADGRRYICDRYHPVPQLLNPDGSIDPKPYYIRPEGRVRLFMRENTHRYCIIPVNVFGRKSHVPTDHRHVIDGPEAIVIRKEGIFFLALGEIDVDGTKYVGPTAMTFPEDKGITVPKGACGVLLWRI
jgi:hypothetical protein